MVWRRSAPDFLGFLAAAEREGGELEASNHGDLVVYRKPDPERADGERDRGV
jgi:hypothetical protein